MPDIVERELGTDPHSVDSRQSGIKDSENKNPMYRSHRLSEEEKIYQAVMEAICLRSRLNLRDPNGESLWYDAGPVDPDTPLILRAGPRNAAVPIYTHAHAVLMYTAAENQALNSKESDDTAPTFGPPTVGFDNKTSSDQMLGGYGWFQADEVKRLSFKSWFPYQISPDRKRVRIGTRGYNRFDIEIDKINEKWIPVECRLTGHETRHEHWDAASPLRDD